MSQYSNDDLDDFKSKLKSLLGCKYSRKLIADGVSEDCKQIDELLMSSLVEIGCKTMTTPKDADEEQLSAIKVYYSKYKTALMELIVLSMPKELAPCLSLLTATLGQLRHCIQELEESSLMGIPTPIDRELNVNTDDYQLVEAANHASVICVERAINTMHAVSRLVGGNQSTPLPNTLLGNVRSLRSDLTAIHHHLNQVTDSNLRISDGKHNIEQAKNLLQIVDHFAGETYLLVGLKKGSAFAREALAPDTSMSVPMPSPSLYFY